MTKRLDAVIEKLRELPSWEQDEIAARLESELAQLDTWLARTGEQDSDLEAMARQAVQDHREGRTEPFPNDDEHDR
jgi:hypothetical protein